MQPDNTITVYWPNVAVKAAVGALLLWPLIRVVGGVSGLRGIATSLVASSALVAGQVVYEHTRLPSLPLTGSPHVLPEPHRVYDLRPGVEVPSYE